MEIFKGSHGTSLKNAENIKKTKFNIGKGRAGSGIYFWADGNYYIELAIGWFKLNLDRGKFSHLDQLVVIIANLIAEKSEILDFENHFLRNKLDDLATLQGIDKKNKKEITFIFDMFVKELELLYNIKYKIIMIRVAPLDEKYCRNYPIYILGAPLCYIARENSCINIIDIKKEFV